MKFIVYCTTNLKNGKVYIGVYETQTPCEFDGYIGCGIKVPIDTDRPFRINKPNTPLEKAVNKYGYKSFYRSLLAIFETKDEAYKLEEQLVTKDFIKSKISYNTSVGGKKPQMQSRKVLQYSIEGKYIKQWKSLTEASILLEIDILDIIASCAGTQVSAGGFVWKYNNSDSYEGQIIVRGHNPSNEGNAPVVQYSKAGYRMKRFASIDDSAKHFNLQPQSILDCCNNYKNNKSAGGFQWRYESDNKKFLLPLSKVIKTLSEI